MNARYVFDIRSIDATYEGCTLVAEQGLSSGEWMAWMFSPEGSLMGYHTSGFRTLKKLLDAFKIHRPTCFLEIRKE